MTHRERVLSALEHKGYDRIPVKHTQTPEICRMLLEHFGVATNEALLRIVGDDLRHVSPRYVGPPLRRFEDGSWEGIWGERYNNIPYKGGTYPEAVYLPYAGITEIAQLDALPFPSPDWYDYNDLEGQCKEVGDYAVVSGNAGNIDFLNGIGRCRGVEQVLLDVATEDPVFLEIVERRFQFYHTLHERVLRAANGRIDIVHIGEDLGSQNGIIMSPATFDRIFAPRFREFFALAHRYGARTMMHSCGSVRGLIPRLIDLGLDILDVVQVAAAGMGIRELHREFGRDLCFCGSMCVQSVLPFGKPTDVRREVELRLELFADGGLILGPTHAIQVGTPLENILEMYRAAGSLSETEPDLPEAA